MRETCARVLAAALMTGAIATAMGLPTLFDGAGDLGPGVTAPPSSLQRSVRIPALSAPARPDRAERLVTAQTAGPPAEQPAIVRIERSRGAVQVPRPNPPPAGGGPSPTPEPPAPAAPAPAPPAPAPAPETRELTSTTPEPPAATPTAPTTTNGGAGGKKKAQAKGNGNSTADGKHQGKKDAPQAKEPATPVTPAPPAAAPSAAAPPPAVAPEPQDQPEAKEPGQGKGHDKDHRGKD
jgi:hypothetical protein